MRLSDFLNIRSGDQLLIPGLLPIAVTGCIDTDNAPVDDVDARWCSRQVVLAKTPEPIPSNFNALRWKHFPSPDSDEGEAVFSLRDSTDQSIRSPHLTHPLTRPLFRITSDVVADICLHKQTIVDFKVLAQGHVLIQAHQLLELICLLLANRTMVDLDKLYHCARDIADMLRSKLQHASSLTLEIRWRIDLHVLQVIAESLALLTQPRQRAQTDSDLSSLESTQLALDLVTFADTVVAARLESTRTLILATL